MHNLPFEFEIDHIGIAVHSLTEGAKSYFAMGLLGSEPEVVEKENVRVQMFELKNNSRIELLEPTTKDSVIAKFIEKNGPGIHHICFRVKHIRSVMAQLKAQNIRLVHQEPFLGAHNCEVAFVHPRSMGGVLVELSQKLS